MVLEYNKKPNWKSRVLIATATKGLIRYEWYVHRVQTVLPMNWEGKGFDVDYAVLDYGIDDAYNLIFKKAIELNVEWLITLEDDVLVHPMWLMKFDQHMKKRTAPLVSGLYYLKGYPPEPLIFRGLGTGAYTKWKMGDLVSCDGVPMGCLLIHMPIIHELNKRSPAYKAADGKPFNQIIKTPQDGGYDWDTNTYWSKCGTQDLYLCNRIKEEGILEVAGWKKSATKKYPFLVDTNIFCKHIDRNTGAQYP